MTTMNLNYITLLYLLQTLRFHARYNPHAHAENEYKK